MLRKCLTFSEALVLILNHGSGKNNTGTRCLCEQHMWVYFAELLQLLCGQYVVHTDNTAYSSELQQSLESASLKSVLQQSPEPAPPKTVLQSFPESVFPLVELQQSLELSFLQTILQLPPELTAS